MNHPVVWFEVLGNDPIKLQGFYSELFGWKIDADNPPRYGLVEKQPGGIAGGIGPVVEAKGHPGVTVYVNTDDVTRSLERAVQLGGSVVLERTQLPGGTVIGFFRDPAGNVIGLCENEV
jgi:predicted enzyme related to lactoylglutathione lyase